MENESRCKGCGKTILWAKVGDKTIPLDAIAPCYQQTGENTFVRVHNSYVTHFATCSHANQFSRRTATVLIK